MQSLPGGAAVRRVGCAALLILGVVALPRGAVSAAEPFELRDGDRVAFLGNTFIEREQLHGDLELALSLRWPERDVRFRNLGWSGDTVFGEARAYFGSADEGFRNLLETVELVEPTVIFVAYGSNAAFEGEAGLAAFLDGYGRLLEELERRSERIVLLSPIPQERLGPPLPDPEPRNRQLQRYAQAVAELAEQRGHRFVDLFSPLEEAMEQIDAPLTDNTIHLNRRGYAVAAAALLEGLTGDPGPADLSDPRYEPLRERIREKNQMFFHRWRPQNMTYLFGFRDHEQGHLAPEVDRFEAYVERAERAIAELRRTLGAGAEELQEDPS